jgi:hypothetical protein
MTKKKKKDIKIKEVQLKKEAIKRLVKVTDTPKAWAMFNRLWTLSEQAIALQQGKVEPGKPDEA